MWAKVNIIIYSHFTNPGAPCVCTYRRYHTCYFLLFLFLKDNRLGAIQENAAFRIPLDCSSKNLALDVRAFIDQPVGVDAMVDARDPLLDDGPLVQVGCDKMRRGANDLDATVVGLVVWLGALERRQETVVDVDDATGHGFAESRTEDLHVPRQDDKLDIVLLDEVEDLPLLRRLGFLRDGEMMELNAVTSGQGGELRVVGYDQRDLDGELAGLGAEEEIVEAMSDFGHHDEHPRLLGNRPDLIRHLVILGQRVKDGTQMLGRFRRLRAGTEVHPHKEFFANWVRELLQIQNIVLLTGEDARHRVHNAWLIRAGQCEDLIACHC